MTPKERLERIKTAINSGGVYRGYTDSIKPFMEDIKAVEEALEVSYPTSEEVREALQLFWGNNYKVDISITNQIFIESKEDKDGDSCIEWDGEKIYFDWMPCYPPHLITLIGKFYEGVEKK